MHDLESTVLDDRYQVLRQIGGTDERPLVVASDLHRGAVVCLRLWPFSSAMVGPAALPGLAPFPLASGDGPLLPHDFGVDGGIAYTVRPYQTGTSLAARLTADPVTEPAEAVRLVRATAQALQSAHDRGFGHGHLHTAHILLAPGGRLSLCGFDRPGNHYSVAREQHDVRALLLLLSELLAPALGSSWAESGRARSADTYGRPAPLPTPLRDLLGDLDRWLAGDLPSLAMLLHALARVERRLTGVHPVRVGVTTTGRTAGALARRLRHLGPLLQPYLLALALLSGTLLFLAGAFDGSPAEARRLLIYAVAPTATPVVDTASTPSPSVPTPPPPVAFVPADRAPATATATPTREAETEARVATQSWSVPSAAPRWDAPTSTPSGHERRAATEHVAPSPATSRGVEALPRPTATVRRADMPVSPLPTRDVARAASVAPAATARPSVAAMPARPTATSTPASRSASPTAGTPTPRPAATRAATPANAATRAAGGVATATPSRRS